MKKILIIEDDVKIREELSKFLFKYGYECEVLVDFERSIEEARSGKYDLILLDINLPYFDGHHICKTIRKDSDIPIIIVTSRDSEMDELLSINFGADDFITKPYNTQILLARIQSLLRRTSQDHGLKVLKHEGLTLNLMNGEIEYEGKREELTKNELKILSLLMEHPGEILSRNKIIEALWQSDMFVDDNTLTVNVNRLRKKLESIGVKDFLKTKRGQGYIV